MIEVNNPMNYYTRRWVKSEDLNGNGTLFGGRLLAWLDEEGIIYATIQLQSRRVVTKKISEINFVSSPKQGDIVELGMVARKFGKTSITLEVEVRNKMTKEVILTIDEIVFVNLGEDGQPAPHGKTEITDSRCSRCPYSDGCLHVGAESSLSA
jgi:acyl-CoA hydrolase